MASNQQQDFSTDLLRVYYSRLFPYDRMHSWLSYDSAPVSDTCSFSRREWSFTIEDDIYIRYQSFADKAEMMAAIQKRQPHKIDIGAVFTAEPATRASIRPEAFRPVERELVFDVDMTDYDGVRTCCTGANICGRCWPYMTMALIIVDRALREDFNFKHILWVYSGRRGVHCWVCDPEARALPNEARDAIVRYLSVDLGKSEDKASSAFKQPLHPMIRRSYRELEPLFEQYIIDDAGQGLLSDINKCTRLLNTLPDESIRERLHDQWKGRMKDMTGLARWTQLKEAITPSLSAEQANKKRKVNYAELEQWKAELVFTHCYPRLDVNVSKAQNHLLKSPFCIHPKTGRVCVPIDPIRAKEFDPSAVPTLGQLCSQIDAYDANPSNAESGASDTDKTDMKAAVARFDKCFLNDLVSSLRKDRRDKAQQLAAVSMDF